MKKVIIRALSLMLACMMMFGSVGVTASAASSDAKANSFCKSLNKGNKFGNTIGSFKVKVKKKGNTYNFTVTLNAKVGVGAYQLMKSLTPDKYDELIEGFKKTTLDLRKRAKKAGVKKASVRYIVKAGKVKVFEFKDGKVIYNKLDD